MRTPIMRVLIIVLLILLFKSLFKLNTQLRGIGHPARLWNNYTLNTIELLTQVQKGSEWKFDLNAIEIVKSFVLPSSIIGNFTKIYMASLSKIIRLMRLGRSILIILFSLISLVVIQGFIHEAILYSGVSFALAPTQEKCDTTLLLLLHPQEHEVVNSKEKGIDFDGKVCVKKLRDFDEIVKTLALAEDRVIIIAHFFEATEHSPGGIGVPKVFDFVEVLKHPMTALSSYKGKAGSYEYQVLTPRLVEMLSLRSGVEIMLILCALPGIEDTVRAFKEAGATRVYWTDVAELGVEEAFVIAEKMINIPDWKVICDSSTLIECI